ncbi:hypothetical protein [Fulvivirga aurantia]|nr:hypothetical protein [Fulvivirga aurantia]
MKINGSIEIMKPRDKVVHFFREPKYLSEYQDGFVRKELISGEKGQKGAA